MLRTTRYSFAYYILSRSSVSYKRRFLVILEYYQFQGSNATGDCCSKCWGEQQRRQSVTAKKSVAAVEPLPAVASTAPKSDAVLFSGHAQVVAKEEQPITEVATPKKKKKKNASYKTLMAGITNGSGSSADIDKQREKIRSVTGGGAFVKIDKI